MKIYNREELKNSRIFFDKRPPKFLSIFIIFLVFLIAITIVLAEKINKPYIVKAKGEVKVDGSSYISAKGHGVITKIYAQSGDYIKDGEKIISFSSGNEGLQSSMAQKQIKDLKETLKVMNKYEKMLKNEDNKLSLTVTPIYNIDLYVLYW